MTSDEQRDLVEALQPILAKARAAILAVYESGDFFTEEKADHSPVTAADRASHDVLVAGLSQLTPDIPVISEETPGTRETIQPGRRFWLVDPLDGTKEFIRKSGEFTINLGLVDGAGVPEFGVIDVPVQSRTYFGGLGGAGVQDPAGTRVLSPLVAAPAGGQVIALSRSHQGQAEEWLRAHQIAVRRLVYAGSAIKFCWIAEGRVDLYVRLRGTMGWDTAAGQALVCAVGGRVVTLEGEPLRYQPGAFTNPYFIAGRPL